MNHKSQASLTVAVFFLNQLIVARTSAGLGRQRVLKQSEEIAIEIIHSLASKFLDASDVMEMQSQSGFSNAHPLFLWVR
jgi:hypothetical protein